MSSEAQNKFPKNLEMLTNYHAEQHAEGKMIDVEFPINRSKSLKANLEEMILSYRRVGLENMARIIELLLEKEKNFEEIVKIRLILTVDKFTSYGVSYQERPICGNINSNDREGNSILRW